MYLVEHLNGQNVHVIFRSWIQMFKAYLNSWLKLDSLKSTSCSDVLFSVSHAVHRARMFCSLSHTQCLYETLQLRIKMRCGQHRNTVTFTALKKILDFAGRKKKNQCPCLG